LATVDCGKSTVAGGPNLARYSLFPSLQALNTAFDNSIKADDEVLACPGNTSSGPTPWNYTNTPEETAGQVACGTYNGNADVSWSYNQELVLADVQSSDLQSLHDWWNNDS
jgi:serine/threonine kinase PknH